MIELQNTRHHVEFIDLPELKPPVLYALFKLSRYLEPYTNRLIMSCDVHTMKGDRVIHREVKTVKIRSCDVPDIIGYSSITAFKIMKALQAANILKKNTEGDRSFFLNPKYVRAHNSLGAKNAVQLFELFEPEAPVEFNEPDTPSEMDIVD